MLRFFVRYKMTQQEFSNRNIVFFDGVCGLCNTSVDLLMRKDRRRFLLFSPLQGTTAAQFLPKGMTTDASSFIYARKGVIYDRSSAALLVFSDLGGLWKALMIFWIVPRFIRDGVYNFIAKNRYRWFGKKESCRIPTAEERSLFLD